MKNCSCVTFLDRGTLVCHKETIIWADLLLQMKALSLHAEGRVQLVHKLSEYLHLTPASVRLLTYRDMPTLLRENITALAQGDGKNGTEGKVAPSSELLWPVGCGVFDQLSDLAQVLDHSMTTGHLATLLGTPVLGWRVLGNKYPSRARRSPLHQHQTPTPTLSLPPPTRVAEVQDYHASVKLTMTLTDILKPSLLLETTPALVSTSNMKVTQTPRISPWDVISHTQTYSETKVKELISSKQLDVIPHLFEDQSTELELSIIQILTSGLNYPESTDTIQLSHVPRTEPMYLENVKSLHLKTIDVSSEIKHLPSSSFPSTLEPQVTQSLVHDFNQDLIFHDTLKPSLKVKHTSTHTLTSPTSNEFTVLWETNTPTGSKYVLEPSHSFVGSTSFETRDTSVMSKSLAPLVMYSTAQVQSAVELSEMSISKANMKLQESKTMQPIWSSFRTLSLASSTPYLTTPFQSNKAFPIDPDTLLETHAGVSGPHLSPDGHIINQQHLTSSDSGAAATKAMDTVDSGGTTILSSVNIGGHISSDERRSQPRTASPLIMLTEYWSVLEPSQHPLYIESTVFGWEPKISDAQTSQYMQSSDLSSRDLDRKDIAHFTSLENYNQEITILPTPTILTPLHFFSTDDEQQESMSVLSTLPTESLSFYLHVHSQISHHFVYPSVLLKTSPLHVVSSVVFPGLTEISLISSKVFLITPTSTESLTTHIHDLHYSVLTQAPMYLSGSLTELPTTMPVPVLTETPSIISGFSHLLDQQVSSSLMVFVSPVGESLSTLWMENTPPLDRVSLYQASDTTGT